MMSLAFLIIFTYWLAFFDKFDHDPKTMMKLSIGLLVVGFITDLIIW